jgi:hypothetical protein
MSSLTVMLRNEYLIKNIQISFYKQVHIYDIQPVVVPQLKIKHKERHHCLKQYEYFTGNLLSLIGRISKEVININTGKKEFRSYQNKPENAFNTKVIILPAVPYILNSLSMRKGTRPDLCFRSWIPINKFYKMFSHCLGLCRRSPKIHRKGLRFINNFNAPVNRFKLFNIVFQGAHKTLSMLWR